ncbi:MAG: DUF2461 domain-containing protein [Gammaproteobacteria bacterium]|nr:DUF2461 domain-containing protein [Gammaproteobacteria bacterium]MCW8986044.1 DUF2461 domain-containing protein [Gammaproteobacteria bacterium]MCW9031510.1 DUF2461 domain-containing protein [Gammaproteobacteria bacterium]
MANLYFTSHGMAFLTLLKNNNNREWFHKNKTDYEDLIRTPALNFIAAIENDLTHLSPHFLAIAKKVGGSLMRVHRDVRFSKDKSPYKTNIGIQFRHEMGKDVHAPGFYVHIAPDECFIGVGIWRPDSTALAKIRDAIVERDASWLAAVNNKKFKKNFDISGESLKNAPRGYAKAHPLLDDLKRKDFIAISYLHKEEVLAKNFKQQVIKRFTEAEPYMQFLCKALSLRY